MATKQTTIFNDGIKQFQRPSSTTAVTYDSYEQLLQRYDIKSVTGGTPNANGYLSVDDTNPSNVAFIKIYKTDVGGISRAALLESMSRGGTIYMLVTATGSIDATYRILFITDFGTYVSFQVEYVTGGGSIPSWPLNERIDRMDFDSDYPVVLNHGYNYLRVTNNSGRTQPIRLIRPPQLEAGEEVVVEIWTGTGGSSVEVKYELSIGDSSTNGPDSRNIYYPSSTTTNTPLTLAINTRGVVKFMGWYQSATRNGLWVLSASYLAVN
jgi:hypothetical protein